MEDPLVRGFQMGHQMKPYTRLDHAARPAHRAGPDGKGQSLRTGMKCVLLLFYVVALGAYAHSSSGPYFKSGNDRQQFGNSVVAATWLHHGHMLTHMSVSDRVNHRRLPVVAPFEITMDDGTTFGPNNMHLLAPVTVAALAVDPQAARQARHLPGKATSARFGDAGGRFRVKLRWVLRKGSDYLREIVTLTALKRDERIKRVDLLHMRAAQAHVVGGVDGSPVVAGHDYAGFEQPLSHSQVQGNDITLWIRRTLPLRKGNSVTYSAVVGVTRSNQLRREFLTYLERERAHPYRPFLTYNSWYDIGFFSRYTQAQALDRIHALGKQLVRKRHVTLNSFLFDDGWDDRSGNWNFSTYFPHGFAPLQKAAARYGAAPGIWLSPWGGYGAPKKERVRCGKAAGYETINGGLALSGSRYYKRFHHVVMKLIRKDGVNQFKFDGTGNADRVVSGSRFDSDFAAAIQLIEDARRAEPNIFINLTTGTYPSPFWLRYADSIWRGGDDHAFAGVGSRRERWITYRDEQVYENIVVKGPLFPLNSLMLHGIIYAQQANGLATDPGHDFANEVHSYFASGTDLQEMYITPSLLSTANWDTLSAAARWARRHAHVMKDTHWIGGDPGRLDVYGWAAWTPHESVLTLRNPSNKPQLAIIDLARQLQLPPGAVRRYCAHRVWTAHTASGLKKLSADHAVTVSLKPFEVLTLDMHPASAAHAQRQ